MGFDCVVYLHLDISCILRHYTLHVASDILYHIVHVIVAIAYMFVIHLFFLLSTDSNNSHSAWSKQVRKLSVCAMWNKCMCSNGNCILAMLQFLAYSGSEHKHWLVVVPPTPHVILAQNFCKWVKCWCINLPCSIKIKKCFYIQPTTTVPCKVHLWLTGSGCWIFKTIFLEIKQKKKSSCFFFRLTVSIYIFQPACHQRIKKYNGRLIHLQKGVYM